MPRKPKVNYMEPIETWCRLESERRGEQRTEYEQFRPTLFGLAPLDKAAKWLSYISEHRTCNGDLESLVFLISRGRDVSSTRRQVIEEWKDAERKVIAKYNNEQHARGGPIVTVNDVATSERIPDFWWGRDGQEFGSNATMLRTVEWCQIGGFEHWWERLARESIEYVMLSHDETVIRALWLFANCRSDYAIRTIPKALQKALDRIAVSRMSGTLPWQSVSYDQAAKRMVSDSILTASAIVFAEHRLNYESGFLKEAIGAIQRHFDNGSWPEYTDKGVRSMEATAMAMHALGVARPMGWEHMMADASSWLLEVQDEDGCWPDPAAPDHVYLTVLVLDALSLASQPAGPLTFGRQGATSSAQSDQTKPQELSVPASAAHLTLKSTKEERKAAVTAYREEVFQRTGKRITKTGVWTAAGYENRSEFERWERADPRATKAAHENFVRVLTQKPHLKPKS